MKNKKIILLVLSLLSIVALSVYYSSSVQSSRSDERFELVTLEGEKSTVENLQLTGDLSQLNGIGRSVKVSVDGVEYLNTDFIQTDYIYRNSIIEKYQEKYPSFMRGKSNYDNNFIENDEFLFFFEDYYQNFNSSEDTKKVFLRVARFDKETEEEITNEILIETDYPINYVSIHNMQTVDKYIILDVFISNRNDYSEFSFVYIYDIEQDKIIDKIETTQSSMGDESWSNTSVGILNHEPAELLLESEEFTDMIGTTGIKFQKYTIETKELQPLTVEEPLLLGNEIKYNHVQYDGKIYFLLNDKDKYFIRVFDTVTNTFILDQELNLDNTVFQESDSILITKQENSGDIILYEPYIESDLNDNPAGIAVFNIQTLEKKYEGYFEYESEYEYSYIYIDQIKSE